MNEMTRPGFVIIPTMLIDDAKLGRIDIIVYGYILWLTKLRDNKCIASNQTLAHLCRTSAGTVRNSLTKLEKNGYIERVFWDENRRKRERIIPLFDGEVSPDDDSVALVDDSVASMDDKSVSSVSAQNNSSTKKKKNKVEQGNDMSSFSVARKRVSSDSERPVKRKREKVRDLIAEEVVDYLRRAQKVPRLDQSFDQNVRYSRELIEFFSPRVDGSEARAVEWAKRLIDAVMASDFDKDNAYNVGYISRNANRLCNNLLLVYGYPDISTGPESDEVH